MNILLYDDHNFVTEAIEQYISNHSQAHIAARCHTVAEVKNELLNNEIDIMVSDVLSDEDAGLSLFEYVTKNHPDTKLIIYSSITNAFVIQTLLDIGISSVVNKKESIATLLEEIQKIKIQPKFKSKTTVSTLKITKREKEIAIWLAKGLSAKEIADKIGSSQNTINNQKNALLEKFECTNSTELVVKLIHIGLISPS